MRLSKSGRCLFTSMDSTAFSNTSHSGERRELLTSNGSTCPPTVISSLRQLQSVTEGGIARRRRRRTYLSSPRDVVSGVYENTRNSNNLIAGWDTDSSAWDTTGATSKGHRVLLPFAMLRKMQKPEFTETESVVVKDGTMEGRRSFLQLVENTIVEATSDAPTQSAARRRRIDSGFMETSIDKETEKAGRKAFSLVEAPTRAPSQKSIAGRDALPNTNCLIDNWQNVSRTNGHGLQTNEEVVPEMIRGKQTPVIWGNQNAKDDLEKLGTKRVYPPAAAVEGTGVRREVFCSASHGGARCPEPVETDEKVTQEHKQSVLKNVLVGKEGNWSSNDDLASIYRRRFPRIEGHTSHENVGGPGLLVEKETHPNRGEKKGCARIGLLQRVDEVIFEAVSTASNDDPEKLRRLQLLSPQRIRGEKQNRKGHSGGDDDILSVAPCYEQEKKIVGLTCSEGQPHRGIDGERSNRVAVDYGSVKGLSYLRKQPAENHFSHPHPREERISPPGRKLETTGSCGKDGRFREQDTITRTVLLPSEDTVCTLARGKTREQEEGAEHVGEGLDKYPEAESENRTSTARTESGSMQEKCLVNASCAREEKSGECDVLTDAGVSLSPSNGKKDALPASLAVDTPNPLPEGEALLGLPSKNSDRPTFIIEAPASVSLYYHVQEASPRPRKRFPMHNATDTTQQPNRLYPVVKGVSRDNAKRRWAVYWKGSRRYFYDKLNENCYHAYQQAVNFRKYNYIQHASRGKNFSVAKSTPGYKKERSPLKQFGNNCVDVASLAKADSTDKYHTETVSLNDTVQLSSPLPRESETPFRESPQNLSAPVRRAPLLVPNSHHRASEGDAQLVGQANSSPCLERTCQFATKESLELVDDGAAGGGFPLNPLPREELSADPVLNMYKTALLMVLQDLKASLTGLPSSPAPQESSSYVESSSRSSQESRDDLPSTNCPAPSCHLEDRSPRSQLLRSAQNTDIQGAEPHLRLRPFLLLIVEWHLETVKLASQRRELQPLLGVFSPCFQHLLLPRDAPRSVQQKIYRELMEIHTTQALSHLTKA